MTNPTSPCGARWEMKSILLHSSTSWCLPVYQALNQRDGPQCPRSLLTDVEHHALGARFSFDLTTCSDPSYLHGTPRLPK